MKKIILPILLLFAFLVSCKKEGFKNLNYVKYRTSFGMCVGYCQNEIEIGGGKVVFTKRQNQNGSIYKSCNRPMSDAEVAALTATIDADKFSKLPEVIGCPDCADGGAESIEISSRGVRKTVVFEYGKAPKELQEAVTKFRAIRGTFSNCD